MDADETAEVANRLEEMFRDAQAGLARFIAFGLYGHEVKELRLKHGQFGDWIKEHCPGIPWRTAQHYMAMTKGLLYACGCKIEDYVQMRKRCAFAHGGELILKDVSDLPESVRPLASKMRAMIEGKTAKQLFLEFKTADEHEGEVIVRSAGIGDKQWERWVWEFHVELVNDGKVPGRRDVGPEILDEFNAYLESKRAKPDPVRQAAADRENAWADWSMVLAKLRLHREGLQHLSNHELDQILNGLVETSNLIREMRHPKGGKRAA